MKKSNKGGKSQVLRRGKKTAKEIATLATASNKEDVQITLIERLRRENKEVKTAVGKKPELNRWAFALWLSIPTRYKGAPEAVINALGMSDPDALELVRLRNRKEYMEAIGISHQALVDWSREFEEGEEKHGHRKLFAKMGKEMLGALYKKGIETGNAEEFRVFMQYVEGWMPGVAVGTPGDVNEIDPERKKALDNLLDKGGLR